MLTDVIDSHPSPSDHLEPFRRLQNGGSDFCFGPDYQSIVFWDDGKKLIGGETLAFVDIQGIAEEGQAIWRELFGDEDSVIARHEWFQFNSSQLSYDDE